jgi:hypothetical protein
MLSSSRSADVNAVSHGPCQPLPAALARYMLRSAAPARLPAAPGRSLGVVQTHRAPPLCGPASGPPKKIASWHAICYRGVVKILDVPRSGSYAGVTSSHNRFGQYVRNRRAPVNPGTSYQRDVRQRLATNSAAYRSLTAAQHAGWAALGLQITRTDSLGSTYTLTGLQAYILLNNNLAAAGDAVVSTAPSLTTPAGLPFVSLSASPTTMSVGWLPTPVGAGERVFIFGSPQRSAGRSFEGDYRLIAVTAAAASSPYDAFSAYVARFGAPVTGNRIFISLQRYSGGFLSNPNSLSIVIP